MPPGVRRSPALAGCESCIRHVTQSPTVPIYTRPSDFIPTDLHFGRMAFEHHLRGPASRCLQYHPNGEGGAARLSRSSGSLDMLYGTAFQTAGTGPGLRMGACGTYPFRRRLALWSNLHHSPSLADLFEKHRYHPGCIRNIRTCCLVCQISTAYCHWRYE